MKEQLKIDFNKIQEVSNFSNRDIEIKKSYLNKFIENGFPNRKQENWKFLDCLLYTSPSPRDPM